MSASKPAASQIDVASRHERSCDSSGCPNALSCASASVATNSLRRSCVSKMGSPPDVSAWTAEQDLVTAREVCHSAHNPARSSRQEDTVKASPTPAVEPIKVGVIADQ